MHPTLRLCGRSAWKGPYFVEFPKLSESIEKKILIQTQARNCTILPSFIGARFGVHNGKTYVPVTITQDMVGHKLGEFSPTRKKFTFKQTRNA